LKFLPLLFTLALCAHAEGAPSLELRGWIGDFGGDAGPPSAAAADDTQIYLGWSLATAAADAIVACDTAGNVRWTCRRGPVSGCRVLAVDNGLVYVLGGEGRDADGRAIFRLSATNGAPVPWPDGRIDLRIVSLWPPKGDYKPDVTYYMAAKNGRIYVSFTHGQFVAILDAKTGAYLQTIVGAPPGPVAAVPTRADAPGKPGKLIDADFLATSLSGGAIGKVLLAHDPIWVLASELAPLQWDQRIAAMTVIGDAGKYHPGDLFVAFAAPWNQVQACSAVECERVTYLAGTAGGRFPRGPLQAGRMDDIRAIALDGSGQLWAAEGNSTPGRISVWTTDAPHGQLAREFFSPPDPSSPVAVDPLDPSLIFAGGCEWRIFYKAGPARCLGVVTRQPLRSARYAVKNGIRFLVLTPCVGPDIVFERFGNGDYRPWFGSVPPPQPPAFHLLPAPPGQWRFADARGALSATLLDPTMGAAHPVLTQSANGRLFITAAAGRTWIFELIGLRATAP